MQKRVVLIDDDPLFTERLREAVGTTVCLNIVPATDDVLGICSHWAPDLIVLDVLLTPGDPFKVLDEICSRQQDARPAVLCLSRGAGSTTRVQRFGGVVFGALQREIDIDQLRLIIADALGLSTGTINPVAA